MINSSKLILYLSIKNSTDIIILNEEIILNNEIKKEVEELSNAFKICLRDQMSEFWMCLLRKTNKYNQSDFKLSVSKTHFRVNWTGNYISLRLVSFFDKNELLKKIEKEKVKLKKEYNNLFKPKNVEVNKMINKKIIL